MKSFTFFLLGVSYANDCANVPIWVPGIYPEAGFFVKQNGLLYRSGWYASLTDAPGVSPAWSPLGECTSSPFSDYKIDCSSFGSWSSEQVYPNPTPVQHAQRAWRNLFYAQGEHQEPGVSGSWSPLAACDSPGVLPTLPIVRSTTTQNEVQPTYPPTGDTNTRVSTPSFTGSGSTSTIIYQPTQSTQLLGGKEDCSQINRWSGTYTYKSKGSQVHFRGGLYENQWYVSGTKPDQDSAWKSIGKCVQGTDSLGVPSDGHGLGPNGEERLCTCCHGCAEAQGINPVCHDSVTDEWDCLYTWCPTHNTFDEPMCQKVKDEGMLEWYSGELVEGHEQWPERVFIPYVDCTLGSQRKLTEIYEQTGVSYFVLAFVTATGSGCNGGFGGFVPVGKGPSWWSIEGEINMYSEVNKLRKLGGDAIVSLGGASGTELANAPGCQGPDGVAKLRKTYEDILDILKMKVLDFDIEGPAIKIEHREVAWANRFEAVKQIVAERPYLRVWWTLPTLPSGLTADGLAFIHDMMKTGARWNVLNLMMMDYGDDDVVCRDASGRPDMHLCEQMALDSVAKQLYSTAQELELLKEYRWSSYKDVYPRMGSTVMIGVNDVSTEVYTLEDAGKSMNVWKEEKKVNTLSQWSIARDTPCAQNSASPSCSGGNVQTKDFDFAKIFNQIMKE